MLTADYLDALPESYLKLIRSFEDSIIQDMARRISKMDVSSATAWQFQRLSESGSLEEFMYEELAKLTGQSEAVLRQKMEAAGVETLKFDDAIYETAGYHPTPLFASPAMKQVAYAGWQKTNGLMRNLTLTTVQDTKNVFIDAVDRAYLQVSTGTMDYNTAIKHAIKQMANDGLSVVSFASGRRDHIDVAARRTLLTGISQTAAQLQLNRMDEMGTDLVQTSAHVGSRPTHQPWQGKIFSRSGTHDKYPDFRSSTGYGTVSGLCGAGCRHSFYAFFEGISENAYKQAELDNFADKTVTYNGEQMTVYDATQKQREIERYIRHWKRQADALQAGGIDNSAEMVKVRRGQQQMRSFVKQTGLSRQSVREQVNGGKFRAPKLSAYDREVDENRQSLDRARKITPADLDTGAVTGNQADYMYNFFSYDATGNPTFNSDLLIGAKSDFLYNIHTIGRGRVTAPLMHGIREKAAALAAGNEHLNSRIFTLKERRVLERLASADDNSVFEEIDKIRDQRLRGRLTSGSYGSSGRTEPKFTSAQEEDAINQLRENQKPRWIP